MPPVQVGTGCAQGTLLSLSAVHIPGHMDVGADILSRQGLRPGEWRLYLEVVMQIWQRFSKVDVDLVASEESTHCPLWFSLIP